VDRYGAEVLSSSQKQATYAFPQHGTDNLFSALKILLLANSIYAVAAFFKET
jgi:hypothetical protein